MDRQLHTKNGELMGDELLFLGRQPILDKDRKVVEFELLFRSSGSNWAEISDDFTALKRTSFIQRIRHRNRARFSIHIRRMSRVQSGSMG